MSHAHARITAERFRQLADETGIAAYQDIAQDHAALPGAMHVLAIAEIVKAERDRIADRCHVAAARVTCSMACHQTAELPIIESIEDLRAELAARLAVRS